MSGSIVQFRPTIGFDYEELTVTNSIQVLSASKYANATSGLALVAFITNDGDALRYRYDGGSPSATVGHKLADGGILVLTGQNQMSNFKAFRVTTDTTLRVSFERE